MRPPISSGTVYVKDPIDVWNKEHTIGNAELAARLGSPSTFDRRGTVFAYDDFENAPLKWSSSFGTSNGGTDYSISLSDEHPSRGSGCMKIIAPDAIGDYSYATRTNGGIAVGRIGIEMNITFYGTVNISPSIVALFSTGTKQVTAGVRINQSGAGGLSYLNNTSGAVYLDASYTTFNDTFLIAQGVPYPLKFVVDLDNEKYVRCIFGGTEIDMSSYTPYSTNYTYVQNITTGVCVVSKYAGHSGDPRIYIDDFILTIEEPE